MLRFYYWGISVTKDRWVYYACKVSSLFCLLFKWTTIGILLSSHEFIEIYRLRWLWWSLLCSIGVDWRYLPLTSTFNRFQYFSIEKQWHFLVMLCYHRWLCHLRTNHRLLKMLLLLHMHHISDSSKLNLTILLKRHHHLCNVGYFLHGLLLL